MTGSQWGDSREDRRLAAEVRARREACCRCGKPINYGLPREHPASFTVDHFPYPKSIYPHLARDPSNLRAAHRMCNSQSGNRIESIKVDPRLGEISEQW